jgi:hypothetical protein
MFVVRLRKTHDKVLCLSCIFVRRLTKFKKNLGFFLFVHYKYITLYYIFQFGTHLDLFAIFKEFIPLKGLFSVKSNLNYKCIKL